MLWKCLGESDRLSSQVIGEGVAHEPDTHELAGDLSRCQLGDHAKTYGTDAKFREGVDEKDSDKPERTDANLLRPREPGCIRHDQETDADQDQCHGELAW